MRVVVFLGPTLSLADARDVLPDALYLPPVRCGDVLAALRLQPKIVVIIDGTFERNPSVWHKEIAVALERGVCVIGAASMGALRATEMEPWGMIGVGAIFEAFRSGELVDDDEVAVVHGRNGENLSIAMVDIRATMALAVSEGVVSQALAAELIEAAKATFYPDRALDERLFMATTGGREDPKEPNGEARLASRAGELDRLRAWLREHGIARQKQADARQALERARDWSERTPSAVVEAPRTSGLRVLVREVAARPIHATSGDGLDSQERIVRAARFLGPPYRDAKRLAELMAALHELRAPAKGARELGVWWGPAFVDREGLEPHEARDLEDRIERIARLEAEHLKPPSDVTTRLAFFARSREDRYSRWLDAIDGPRQDRTDAAAHARRLLARAWRLVDLVAQRAGLVPDARLLEREVLALRAELNLFDDASVTSWLAEHAPNQHDFAALIVARIRWQALASAAQPLGLTDGATPVTTFFLADALRISGLYTQARELICAPAAAREALATLPGSLPEALGRDIDTDDPALLRRELERL